MEFGRFVGQASLYLSMSDTTEQIANNQPSQTPPATSPAKKKSAAGALTFKVSAKGAVSVYGLGRFPVTLYHEQWRRLLSSVPALETFLEQNKSQLKSKDSTAPSESTEEQAESAASE